jgi:hypothetical protein
LIIRRRPVHDVTEASGELVFVADGQVTFVVNDDKSALSGNVSSFWTLSHRENAFESPYGSLGPRESMAATHGAPSSTRS